MDERLDPIPRHLKHVQPDFRLLIDFGVVLHE